MLGAGVAHADEDCLHQNAYSKNWADAQQQVLAMNKAPGTTGLLFTHPNGTDSITTSSGK